MRQTHCLFVSGFLLHEQPVFRPCCAGQMSGWRDETKEKTESVNAIHLSQNSYRFPSHFAMKRPLVVKQKSASAWNKFRISIFALS
jgi:hypothetical protein